jgi:hypothetical protein
MRLLQLTQELNELGIGVMDRQVRFQIYGPPLVLRMLKQGPWLLLWSILPSRICGAFSRMPRDHRNFISVGCLRIADGY